MRQAYPKQLMTAFQQKTNVLLLQEVMLPLWLLPVLGWLLLWLELTLQLTK